MGLNSGGSNHAVMDQVDPSGAGGAGDGAVSDFGGLLTEVLLVGVVVTVYLIGVATDRDGRKI